MRMQMQMQMQGDDNYCGLCCLSTAARSFGLSGRVRSEWRAIADATGGIGVRKLVEIAEAMGMTTMRRPWCHAEEIARDLADPEANSHWIVRIKCSLPYAKSRTGRWTGVHYVLVLAMKRSVVTVGDPYRQADLDPVRDAPRHRFMEEWRGGNNWAIRLSRRTDA